MARHAPDCVRCAGATRCRNQADFCQEHLFSWAKSQVLECANFRESRYRGRVMAAKVLPFVESAPFFLMQREEDL